MIDLFKEAGYKIVDFENTADIYVINSCTVTNQAASKSRKRARRAKRRNSESRVIMVGCYPQAFPEEVEEIEEIDNIIGAQGKKDIVKVVEETIKENNQNFLASITQYDDFKGYEELRVKNVSETTRANVKIEDGCNQFCSYCIIPYARGPVRSREKESITKEVNSLVDKGINEIVLTGTHLGNYGLDDDNSHALSKLVEDLIQLNGEFRIRLSSIEVTEIDDRLIDLISNNDKLCPHLHIPLQSGCNKVLEAMRRPYNQEDFRRLVKKLRKKIPDIAITTDVIVGFPGESQADFQVTYDFIKEIGFSRLHVFPYSVREGTPASKMGDRVNGNIIKERSKKMRELNRKLMLNYQREFIDRVRTVIIEDKYDYDTGFLTGVTDNYLRVLVDAEEKFQEKMVDVKILKSCDHESVMGKIIE
jgi:threonylcarbamoyladenosine tRNA methylthiotransferase MtaB